MSDLVLVNPSYSKKSYGSFRSELAAVEPPLWCALLAAFIREHGYSVEIIDAEAEESSPESVVKRVKTANPKLVVIVVLGTNPSASSTPKMADVKRLLILLRESFSGYTALCGLHPSALPERTLREEEVDFIIQGEGFYTIQRLLKSKEGDYNIPGLWYRVGERIISNPISLLIDLDDLPIAAWDLLPMDKYRAHNWHCFGGHEREPYGVIYTSLGCPFKCSYCNIHAMYGKSAIRYRDPKKVIEEIEVLVEEYGVKNIKIIDELFAFNEKHVNELCEIIIDRGYDLNMWAYARADTINPVMLKNMKLAGINWLGIGYESANEAVRLGVSKKIGKDAIQNSVKMIHNAGVHIIGNFIFGLPSDTIETMQETLDLAKKLNLEYVNFYTAMAYPGSQLYLDCIKNGTKLPETWLGYSQLSEETLPLSTKYLSSAEILRFRDRAFVEYFNRAGYIDMIRDKFGEMAVEHIRYMLQHKIKRI